MLGATHSIAGGRAARVSAGAGATYSITGEVDMECETETSVRILWHQHLMLGQLGLVVDIVKGNVDLCSGSSGSS